METDYQKIGLKCGIEIHQQLATNKLFCACSSGMHHKPKGEIVRKLRAVAGELGEIDVAAQHETLKGKSFDYKIYPEESCLVESDEEPPHPMNREALETALQIALVLNCNIPDEIQVMRKTVLDGSDTTGFQRTVIVGMNGFVETSFGKVGIANVAVEEEAAQILGEKGNEKIYGLNRLGIPLVEIGTDPDVKSPGQAKELAEKLGMVLKSTGKIKAGVGVIRQDLNVSIAGGVRVEVKGVQSLSLIPTVVELEAERQKAAIEKGHKIAREVRKALPDGKTEFLRPMPGAARLYPETDIPPVRIDKLYLEKLKMRLPEPLESMEKRLVQQYRLSPEIAKQIAQSGRAGVFEFLAGWVEPSTVAATLTTVLTNLRRGGVPVEKLEQEHFAKVFEGLKEGKIAKEAIPNVLKLLAAEPKEKIENIVKNLNIETISEDDLRKIVIKIIAEKQELLQKPNREQVFMGMVMAQARGKISGQVVARVLKEELGKV